MTAALKTDLPATVRLLRALHTAGWRHGVAHEEGDRDWETGAYENSGYLIHRWTRRLDEIQACWNIDHRQFIGSITLGPVEPEEEYGPDDRIQVSVERVKLRGVDELYRLAIAAGVLPEAQRSAVKR